MNKHIRLDRGGDGVGFSTVGIASDDATDRSVHWGHANGSQPIVTVQIGFVSITVDEEVVGKPKLRALRRAYEYSLESKPIIEASILETTTPENRRDAVVATIDAGRPDMAAQISREALFDVVILDVVSKLAAEMTPSRLVALFGAAIQEAENAAEDGYRRGVDATKRELRDWLGIGFSRGYGPGNS